MHYFIDPIKKYAVFKGRASRKEFWMFLLFYFVFSLLLGFITGLILAFAGVAKENVSKIGNYVGYAYALALVLPYLALYIRRIQDSDNSGWFILVPLYNIFLLFIDGTQGDNKYGPNPNSATMPQAPQVQVSPEQQTPPVNPQ